MRFPETTSGPWAVCCMPFYLFRHVIMTRLDASLPPLAGNQNTWDIDTTDQNAREVYTTHANTLGIAITTPT